ncbi:MAG: tetratricopeptide repeat protein [Gemmatimonadota bacterium]
MNHQQGRERELATILFTDIVGSTERAVDLGDRRWRDLLVRHHTAVRNVLGRFGGREVNTAGDGFVAVFDDPERALHASAAIREAVRELGLELRCGLHMGHVEGEAPAVTGVALHVGARVAGEAGAGEILASRIVHDAVEGGGFGFVDLGTVDLRGLPGDRRLFRLTSIPESPPPEEAVVPAPARRWRRPALIAGTVAVAAVAGFLLVSRGGNGGRSGVASAAVAPGIAVLPFSVASPEFEVWREGMVDALSATLDGAAGLRAIDSRTVLARWRESVSGNETPDIPTALDVARRSGARYALLGSVVASGTEMQLISDVYDVDGGRSLGQVLVDGAADSVFQLVDRLSLEILAVVLREKELPDVDLTRVTTTSLPALRDFLEGEVLFRKGDFRSAIEEYERAVAADTTFALAYYHLAQSYGWTGRIEFVGPAAARSMRFVDRLSDRDALLVKGTYAFEAGMPAGLELLRTATRKYPDDAEAWNLLGDFIFHHGGALLVDPEEGHAALKRATWLDPAFAPAYLHQVHNLLRTRPDSAGTAELIRAYARYGAGDSVGTAESALLIRLAFGDDSTRARALRTLDTLSTSFLPFFAHQNLSHPRYLDLKTEILALAAGRPAGEESRWGADLLVEARLARGQLGAAFEALDRAAAVSPAYVQLIHPYLAHVRGLPVPAERLEREVSRVPADSIDSRLSLWTGAWALERGRSGAYAQSLATLREGAERARIEGDSIRGRRLEGMAHALEGFGAWRSGRLEEAERELEQARLMTIDLAEDFENRLVRWWLAGLSLERGEKERAAEYYASLGDGAPFASDPVALYRLAQVQEELERFDEARENYELFLLAWREADPELAAWVEKARQAAIRLSGLRRG